MLSQSNPALRWLACAFVLLALSVPPLSSAAAQGRGTAPGLLSSPGNGNGPPPHAMATVRSRMVDVQLDGLKQDRMLVELFEDVSIITARDRLTGDPDGDFVWTGHVVGVEHSRAIVSVSHGAVAALFRWPGALYEVRALPNGRYVLHQIDPEALPQHTNPRAPERRQGQP